MTHAEAIPHTDQIPTPPPCFPSYVKACWACAQLRKSPNKQTKQPTTKTPQPSKIPLLQVKQVKRVRRNPHWIVQKIGQRGANARQAKTPHERAWQQSSGFEYYCDWWAGSGQRPRQTANKNNTNNQNKQNQTNQKTTNEPEPAHQRGETKSEVRHAPD